MEKYEIAYYVNGVKHSRIIEAQNKDEARLVAWRLIDADDIYISEVKER